MSRRSPELPSGVPPAIVAETSAGERDLALLPTGAGVAAFVVAAEEQDDAVSGGVAEEQIPTPSVPTRYLSAAMTAFRCAAERSWSIQRRTGWSPSVVR